MASSAKNARVNRTDELAKYVQLRVSSDDSSVKVLGGVIINGTLVQVLSEQGKFCEVQVKVGSNDIIGFVKKEHLDFGTVASGPEHNRAAIEKSSDSKLPVAIAARCDGRGDFVKLCLKLESESGIFGAGVQVAKASRRDGVANFVKLRPKADASSSFVGNDIPNGTKLGVLASHGDFTQVRHTQADGQVFDGFVKTNYIEFLPKADASSSFVGDDIPNGTKLGVLASHGDFTQVRHTQADGQVFDGFVKTEYLDFELSSKDAMEKFNVVKDSGSLEARWKCLKAYITAKQRENDDYHLQHVRPMDQLMSMKALETLKERAFE
jgi:hypothetical protein